ncbi:MAG TPA: hypothetical protein DCW47_05625 [Lachnospiraceae bacterium]|nr:hypothetical protein [Lachnospiraceae bacterium]
MKITVLICNSMFLSESVLREGEAGEVTIEKQAFLLKKSLRIGLSFDTDSLVATFISGFGQELTREPLVIAEDSFVRLTSGKGELLYLGAFFSEGENIRRFSISGIESISLGRRTKHTLSAARQNLWSRDHLLIERDRDGFYLRTLGTNGCYVNREYIEKDTLKKLGYSDEIIVPGLKLIWLKDSILVSELSFRKNDPGLFIRLEEMPLSKPDEITSAAICNEFHPIPRIVKRLDISRIELDAPPVKQEIRQESVLLALGPSFTMAVPMILGSGLAIYGSQNKGLSGTSSFMYTGLLTAVTAAVLGAVWAAANLRRRRLEERIKEKRRKRAYEDYIREIEEKISEKYLFNLEVLQYMFPSAAGLARTFDIGYLWNRLLRDGDYLTVRLGLGDYPGPAVNLEIPKEHFSLGNDRMRKLPSLLKSRYGVLKDAPACIDLSEDTLFGIVAGEERALERLLFNIVLQLCFFLNPGILKLAVILTKGMISRERTGFFRFLPQLRGEGAYRIGFEKEEAEEIKTRFLNENGPGEGGGVQSEWVIISDDYAEVKELKKQREDLRIMLFTVDYNSLPGECSRIILDNGDFSGVINTRDSAENTQIVFDSIDHSEAERLVRRLGGLRLSGENGHIPIPKTVLIDRIFGISIEELKQYIVKSWKESNTVNDIRIPLGIEEDERICFLDLHESAHGPHGLIAGMTGSGKSEMLQTLILSLAIRYSPRTVSFFLIDYKGGGMAGLFKGLPHISGSISNLSGNNIYRAMVSVRSENERRQKLFLNNNVNRITEYEKKYLTGEAKEPLPHLFIIIDEFAELKKNEPEFMRELVSVAQVGRSLGIHLILATQKPQGTVDDNIRSNSRFRICLRVQDRQDSQDMLHKPDAAFIKEVGRAFLQVGNDELYEEFKGAYTMAVRGSPEKKEELSFLEKNGRREEENRQKRTYRGPGNEEITDFDIVREALLDTAGKLDLAPARRLWMKELGQSIEVNKSCVHDLYTYCLGQYDAPRRQEQGDFTLSLAKGGHHMILGRSGSGKSTLLQTLLCGFLYYETPSDLNTYIIDFSNGLLSAFRESFLSGACLTEEDTDRIKNLFFMLKKEQSSRKALYKGINFLTRKSLGEKASAIVLVIDNYGAFRQKTKEAFDEIVQELLKTGESVGIYLILTGGGVNPSDIPSKVHEACKTVICLTLPDRMNYSQSLRTLRCEVYPVEGIAGRGIGFLDGELLEFQTGLFFPGNDYERGIGIEAFIREKNQEYGELRAKKVPFIPDKPVLSNLLSQAKELWKTEEKKNRELVCGYRTDSGELFTIPLDRISSFIITGRRKSGKTGLINIIRESAAFSGYRCVSVSRPEELVKELKQSEKQIILLNEPSNLIGDIYGSSGKNNEEEILKLIRRNRENGLHNIIFELSREDFNNMTGRGVFEALREEAYGIHLGGMINEQMVFEFSELSFSQKNLSKKAGEGDVPFVSEELFFGGVRLPLWEG